VIRYKQGALEDALDAFQRASGFDPAHQSAQTNAAAIQHLIAQKAGTDDQATDSSGSPSP